MAQRIVTDVACLSGDAEASRRALAGGLYRLFKARLVSVRVHDRWCPEGPARLLHDVHAGPGEVVPPPTTSGSSDPGDPRGHLLTERFLQTARTVRTLDRRDLMPDTEWDATPAGTHLERAEVGETLVSGFPLPGGGSLTVTIHFPRDAGPISNDRRSLLHLISLELRRLHRRRGIGHAGVRTVAAVSEMTPREREVFESMLGGHSVKEIARRIGVKEQTVSGYVKVIYRRLGVHSRGELMARYLRN